jgi:hypothetical protein
MDARRFDRISKLFAQRRAIAQEGTPTPPDQLDHAPELLFVQSFRAGAVAPKEGADGRYMLTLEAGSGQTVYFSERPDRVVGAHPTDQVLDRLGFPDDNPPNAALVFETAPGDTDVAVVELFSPVYDAATGGVTYEVAPLANWQTELEVGLQEAPADLVTVAPSFGAAHLFIDGLLDCPDGRIRCIDLNQGVENRRHDPQRVARRFLQERAQGIRRGKPRVLHSLHDAAGCRRAPSGLRRRQECLGLLESAMRRDLHVVHQLPSDGLVRDRSGLVSDVLLPVLCLSLRTALLVANFHSTAVPSALRAVMPAAA